MKKKLLFTLLVLAAVCIGQEAKAQISSDPTGPVTLTITLEDAIHISLVGSSDVSFLYSTGTDYAGSKTVTRPNHLKVMSSKNYEITVKAATEFTSATAPDGTLPLNLVSISAAAAPASGTSPVALSLQDQTVVTSATATASTLFNVNYIISDASSLIVLPKEDYITTVTYTATQL